MATPLTTHLSQPLPNTLSNTWQRLQNGSDIRGVALEGIAGEAVNLTPDITYRLGQAFCQLASQPARQKTVPSWSYR